jgi:formaldehyde-activating enzyme involved in methanogenesis
MPSGMILFGAAAGVAKALNEGLRDKILEEEAEQELVRHKPFLQAALRGASWAT